MQVVECWLTLYSVWTTTIQLEIFSELFPSLFLSLLHVTITPLLCIYRFLILDPHYTGKDDLKTITDKVSKTEINSTINLYFMTKLVLSMFAVY